MPSATVRINDRTRKLLRELAASTGESMQTVVERAIEDYSQRRFLEEANHAYAQLRRNPDAWQEACDERALWDGTLRDGLGDEL
jgi:hypothetical protein